MGERQPGYVIATTHGSERQGVLRSNHPVGGPALGM